jgi:hypothetical protein
VIGPNDAFESLMTRRSRIHRACGDSLHVLSTGLRGRVTTSREGLHKGGPYKPLTTGKRSTGGRNSTGT